MNLRRVIDAMWLEFKVTRQIATGNAEHYIAAWKTPGWFKRAELGLGQGEGPSILWWAHNLTEHNKRAAAILATKPAPMPVPATTERPKRGSRLNATRARQALLASAKKAGLAERTKMRALRDRLAA